MGFFQRRDDGLEDRLRSLRAEPRDEFVRDLSGHVREHRMRNAARSRRFVAALVTSALMIVPFVAFGGVNYAAAAAKNAVQTVVQVQSNTAPKQDNKPDEDQYKPGKGCGDKNHEHAREDECKKPPK